MRKQGNKGMIMGNYPALRLAWFLFVALSAAGFGGAALAAETSEVDAIEALAMENALTSVDLSPDGKHLSVVRRYQKDGDPFLEIYDLEAMSEKPVVIGADIMKIAFATWVNDDRLLVLFTQDSDLLQGLSGGSTRRAQRVATIDRKGKKWVTLPRKKIDRRSRRERSIGQFIGASLFSSLPLEPDHVLLSYSPTLSGAPDLYRVNVNNGKAKLVERGSFSRSFVAVDAHSVPRLAASYDEADSAQVYWGRVEGSKKWVELGRQKMSADSLALTFSPLGFYNERDPNEILVMSNHESDKISIYTYDLESRSFTGLAFRHPDYDASGIFSDSDTPTNVPAVLGYTYREKTSRVHWLSDAFEEQIALVDEALPGRKNNLVSWSHDRSRWVVRSVGDASPPEWYLLRKGSEAEGSSLEFLGSALPFVNGLPGTPETEWTSYHARDGMKIPTLITKPSFGKRPYPTVIMPHGGPIARDLWDFDPWVQMLARHGYMIVQPQFRGSEGFGRKHLEVSKGQWGLTMQDDLEDAARFVIDRGDAHSQKLAVFGWSYGGYAAFVASYRDPNMFQCAIAGAGVSNLSKLRAEFRYGNDVLDKVYIPYVNGDSPVEHVDSVDIPILVIHGTNDERVSIEHSDEFVAGLRRHKKHHKYVKLEGANHFFGTIFYRHYKIMYPAMIDWLGDTCGLRPEV